MLLQFCFAVVNGLVLGAATFLVAAGLTLTFGILKILNFAHGAFFMIGAYVAYEVVGSRPDSILTLIGAAIVAALAVGVLGLAMDRLLFRNLAGQDQHYTLIATFGLLLVCNGVTKLVWGPDIQATNPPEALEGMVLLGGVPVGIYSLGVVVVSLAVFSLLEWFVHRNWLGKVVMAVARDPWAAALVGINVRLVMTCSVVAGFGLAGLAGGLLLANQSLSPQLGNTYLLLAFNAVIIGGLGDIRGALLAAMLLGLVTSLGTIVLPGFPGLMPYLALVAFLLLRPEGIFPARAHS